MTQIICIIKKRFTVIYCTHYEPELEEYDDVLEVPGCRNIYAIDEDQAVQYAESLYPWLDDYSVWAEPPDGINVFKGK